MFKFIFLTILSLSSLTLQADVHQNDADQSKFVQVIGAVIDKTWKSAVYGPNESKYMLNNLKKIAEKMSCKVNEVEAAWDKVEARVIKTIGFYDLQCPVF